MRHGSSYRRLALALVTVAASSVSLNARASHTLMAPACTGGVGNGFQLKQAVDTASHNGVDDVILLGEGCTYKLHATLNVGPDIGSGLPHTLVIKAAGRAGATIDGQGVTRVFNLQEKKATLTLERITVTGGSAFGSGEGGAGGGMLSHGTVRIVRSHFRGNYAQHAGGGIRNHGTMTLEHSTITGNESRGRGGGIDNNATLTIRHSEIAGNVATRLDGGGINTFLHGVVTIADSTISDNSAAGRGGGMFNSAELTISDSTITGNQAASGGGIHNEQVQPLHPGKLVLQDSVVERNNAFETGGGIANVLGELSGPLPPDPPPPAGPPPSTTKAIVGGSSILDNHAAGRGGGIFNSGELTLASSALERNVARGDGGGVYDAGRATLRDATLSSNAAVRGGAVFASHTPDAGPASLVESTLSTNSATHGAGIFDSGHVVLQRTTVSANRAVDDGGGAWVEGRLAVTNSTFSANAAVTGRGGALFVALASNTEAVAVGSSTIAFNHAVTSGGIFRGGTAGLVSFRNTILGLNTAAQVVARNCTGLLNDGSTNLSDTIPAPCATAGAGFATVPLSGSLAPLAYNGGPTRTHELSSTSPAVGAGAECPLEDQRGHPRDVCDIGSYER